ncbi:hypothetical protein EMPG_12738, partial [Blastomyces silverae]
MAAGPHTFVVADVFTAERYLGNQLAIVSVRNNALSKTRKQRIALEFGYVNTVFLHDAPQPGLPRKLEIFSETEERSFSGQAVLGTAHYIFQKLEGEDSISAGDWPNPTAAETQKRQQQSPKTICRCTLQTKGGLIQSHYDPARQVAAIEIPHN